MDSPSPSSKAIVVKTVDSGLLRGKSKQSDLGPCNGTAEYPPQLALEVDKLESVEEDSGLENEG